MNTLSDLTENFTEHTDSDLTGSSNISSDNDHILLTPRHRKRSFVFNQNNMPTSTLSLLDTPIYARIVKSKSKLLTRTIVEDFILIAPKLLMNDMSTIERRRLNNPLTSAPTLFIKPIDSIDDDTPCELTLKAITLNRLRHASDSDLHNGIQSVKLSSFFQTDV